MGLAYRTVVFTLVLTLSVIGIPCPAHAATGEDAPFLTFQGRPLSAWLQGRPTGALWARPILLTQDDGKRGATPDAQGTTAGPLAGAGARGLLPRLGVPVLDERDRRSDRTFAHLTEYYRKRPLRLGGVRVVEQAFRQPPTRANVAIVAQGRAVDARLCPRSL